MSVDETATVAELVGALRAALAARGHGPGECFLAWDAEGDETITVRVGERGRAAAVSCDGLQAVARALEGRCPFARLFWIEGEDMRTDALTFYFSPPGRAYAARPIAAAGVGSPAADAVFSEAPEGTRLVLGVPLRERSGGARKQDEAAPPSESQSPMDDPEIAEAVQQLVLRMQDCDPERTGSLVLEWQVEPDGTIAGVQPVTYTVSESALECVLAEVAELTFPEHEGERATDFCAPVLLGPSLRRAAASGG